MINSRSVRKTNWIQAVIFDMDGVLIDSHPVHRRAWQEFLRTLSLEVSPSELDFILDGRKRCDILRHFLGEMSDSQLSEYGRLKDEFFQRMSLEVRSMPGVLDFIEDLRDRRVKLALATSASRSRTCSTVQRLGRHGYFSEIVTGDDVADGKPNPAVYEFVCARLDVPPELSLVVEDAPSAVRAAKGAGFLCMGIGNHDARERLSAAGADYVIEDFLDFKLDDLDFLCPARESPSKIISR